MTLLEQLARIDDPEAWAALEADPGDEAARLLVQQSLAKARRMAVALFDRLAEPSEEMIEAAQVELGMEQDAAHSAWRVMLARAREGAMRVLVTIKERT